jgi:lipoate-protein ligase A
MCGTLSLSSKVQSVDLSDNAEIPLRILPFQENTGAENMGIDEKMALNPPNPAIAYLRFYGWRPYCLSLGYHQNSQIVNRKALEKHGYQWIQRPTGGRAIFHAEELTYCAVFPHNIISPKKLYKLLHTCIARALHGLGYNVHLAPDDTVLPRITNANPADSPCFTRPAPTEVRFNGKKLVGSAQRVYPLTILQHGSILMGTKHKLLPNFLFMEKDEKENMIRELDNKTVCLSDIAVLPGIKEDLINGIVKQLEIIANCSLNYN